ncbi:uncharacterized protein TNCT_119301 [Trichonephila clavata]|uniref:Gustatory receptor n=1 Tax=Trichonephila clavata TaxID=2740835 RepID=A0A8X6GDM6_TRICU|nr:uncharacterized protein TNCT_119301 [Trichonephila clavata]
MYFKSTTTVKQFNKKKLHKRIPTFILSYFRWIGFVEASHQHCKRFAVPYVLDFFVFLTCLDVVANIVIAIDPIDSRIDTIFVSSLLLTMVVWYTMRYKNKSFTNFLQTFEGISSSSTQKKFNFLVILNFCTAVIFSSYLTSGISRSEAANNFLYGYEISNFSIQTITIAIKSFLAYMLFPTFGNVFALLYIFLCHCSSDNLNSLTREIEKTLLEDFTLSKQIDILNKRARVYEILLNIEKIFSVPIFFTIVANVLMLSSISGWFLIGNWNETDFAWKIETSFLGTNASLYLTSTLWAAGTVSIEMRKFKEVFHYKTHLKLLSKYSEEQLHLKMDLMNEPDFVLTAWDVVCLSKSTILGLFGALFTYTVLLMNTNNQEK